MKESRVSPSEKEKSAALTDILRLFLRLAVLILLSALLVTKVFLITQASGNDMSPSVKDGDLLFAFRLQRDHEKNDVVIYSRGQEKAVGRIAALEGDVVTLDDSGILLVNGTVQSGALPYPTYAGENLTYPYRVPAGSVFLLGDDRPSARDSRVCGAVPLEDIRGTVFTILRRRGL